MQTKKELDMLTSNGVSVKTVTYTVINGVSYEIGSPSRTSYVNSEYGRGKLAQELSEPYFSAVMAVWGENPTVTEEEPALIGQNEN